MSWQLVAHPDSEMCAMTLLAVQRALRDDTETSTVDTAFNVAEAWDRLRQRLTEVDLVVLGSAMPPDAEASVGLTGREPTKDFIKKLKRSAPALPIIVVANTPDEHLAAFLDAFENVGLVTTGAEFGRRLTERITLLRQTCREQGLRSNPALHQQEARGVTVSTSSMQHADTAATTTKPDTWIQLDLHLGGHQRGWWYMSRIGLDEFLETGTFQMDDTLIQNFITHSKTLDSIVALNGDTWLDNLRALSNELRTLLFRSAPANINLWDNFLKHREQVGGVARSRLRVTVDNATHPMLFEALRDSEKEEDEFWVLNAAVYRRYAHQSAYPPLFKERSEASRSKPLNCLIIQADASPGTLYGEGGQAERLGPLHFLAREADAVHSILAQHAGGDVTVLRLDDVDDPAITLMQTLKMQRWHVVHFCGHVVGDDNRSALVLRAFDKQLLPIETFARLLNKTQLLFLSSCRSAATRIVVHAVERHVAAVLGFQWVIDDQAAMHFAIDFYEQLFQAAASERGLEYALLEARRRAYKRQPAEPAWLAPVLIMQMG